MLKNSVNLLTKPSSIHWKKSLGCAKIKYRKYRNVVRTLI